MATRKLKFLFWFVALALVLACVPAIGAPVATVDPNQISVFIAQTANAAASQTAAAMPTSTATSTPTVTPDDTNTPSPTYTSTVIFILSTPTSPILPTLTGLSNGTSSDNYACQIMSVEPANGTIFKSKAGFDAVWRVKNIGKKTWDSNTVDYAYSSGAKMHKFAKYDLSKNLKSGATISIVVDMVAPKNAGSYTTNWVLRNGTKEFCTMSLTIVVQ